MTARQPPGEKGAKACTIGNNPVSRRVFLRLFFGSKEKKGAKICRKVRDMRYIQDMDGSP